MDFTSTSSSWLNQVERWFAEIIRRRIRRGTFRGVPALITAINNYVRDYKENPRPFHWVASASRIIRKDNKYKAIFTIIAECRPRHRHQEFLWFLDRIDESVNPSLEIQLVFDNYGTHKHPSVRK